jgi:hypothetical protein
VFLHNARRDSVVFMEARITLKEIIFSRRLPGERYTLLTLIRRKRYYPPSLRQPFFQELVRTEVADFLFQALILV